MFFIVFLLLLMIPVPCFTPETGFYFNYKQIECLVKNVYHEARGESKHGRLLVTATVINRAAIKKKSYCEVVYEYKQYSWTLDKRLLDKKIPPAVYRNLETEILQAIDTNSLNKTVTHYHRKDIKPHWSKSLKFFVKVENHIFYGV